MQQPFRAITLRWNGIVCHEALKCIMQDLPFEFCANLSAQPYAYPKLSAENQPWFNTSDLRNGFYAGAVHAELLPLDEKIIEDMRNCEALFMYMMIRAEYAKTIPYLERKQRYLLHLRFWNDFLERRNINLLLSSTLPHEMPDHLIYALCKYKKIRTIFSHATPIRDTAFLQEDIEASAEQIKDRLEELRTVPASDIKLSPKLEEYCKQQTSQEGKYPFIFLEKPQGPLQRYCQRILATPGAFLHWLPSLWSSLKWARRLHKMKSTWAQYRLRKFYDDHAVEPDLQTPYIYFPLQYQPECSTCPMAGAFVDQTVSIHLLSHTAPNNVLIYVKEHPRQRKAGILGRNLAFYKELVAMPNVRLVTHETSTFALREHCSAVATGTGTAGLEGIFRGKPVLLFGHVFYQYAPAVFWIKTCEDCSKAMDEVFRKKVKPDPGAVRRFMKAVEDTRMHASITDWYYLNYSDLPVKESTDAFTDALRKRLTEHS